MRRIWNKKDVEKIKELKIAVEREQHFQKEYIKLLGAELAKLQKYSISIKKDIAEDGIETFFAYEYKDIYDLFIKMEQYGEGDLRYLWQYIFNEIFKLKQLNDCIPATNIYQILAGQYIRI